MKRNFAIALLAVSTLAAYGNAVAQDLGVQATVPFEFTVGGRLLPAGTSTIKSSGSGAIMVRSADGHFVSQTTIFRTDRKSTGVSKLVFDKYGDRYFLRKVLCPSIAGLNVRDPQVKTGEAGAGAGSEVRRGTAGGFDCFPVNGK